MKLEDSPFMQPLKKFPAEFSEADKERLRAVHTCDPTTSAALVDRISIAKGLVKT